MSLVIDSKDINKFILIGDRILIKPKSQHDKTKSGLYLPPGVTEKEKIHSGYIIKAGPGYPIPAINEVVSFCSSVVLYTGDRKIGARLSPSSIASTDMCVMVNSTEPL